MMRRRIFTRKLLADIFVFAILHSILSVAIFLITWDMRSVMMTGFLAAPFFLMFVIRGKVRNFFFFMALHILLVIWIIQVPVSMGILSACVIFLAVSAVYSLAVRLKGGSWSMDNSSLPFGLGVLAFAAVILEYNEIRELSGLLAFWAFIVIACWMLYTQTIRIDDATGLLYGQPRRPVGAIVRFNNIIISGFLLVTAIAALLSGYLPVNILFSNLKRIFLSLIRWLSGLIQFESAEEVLPEEPAQPSADMSDLLGAPDKAPPEWLQALERIFFYAIQIAIILGIVAAVLYGIYSLYRKFYASGETDGDTREYVGPVTGKDSLKRLFQTVRGRALGFGGGAREKIRRVYYKKVRRHMRKGVKIRREDTPGEIAAKISQSEDISELTDIYEKARYSAPPSA